MAKGTQAAKVGLFVVLAGAAAFGVYRFISPESGVGTGYEVHAFIRDATGLAPRSRVTIAGISVGTLEDIKLVNGEARLDVKVHGDVVLYDNATLGKKAASLLGESVVVMTPGTADHRRRCQVSVRLTLLPGGAIWRRGALAPPVQRESEARSS